MSVTVGGLRIDPSRPALAVRELVGLNERLAREPTVPPHVAEAVHSLAGSVTDTDLARWEAVDPYHALVVHRAVIDAEEALADQDARRGRDRLRVALEAVRQALEAIAEGEPMSEERTPKEIVQWLAERTRGEVPQIRLAALLGVSQRQFQRWASAQEPSAPEGNEARRVRTFARLFSQLRFALTPAGAVAWFDWPRADLGGRAPSELLADPAAMPRLLAAAASMRSASAS